MSEERPHGATPVRPSKDPDGHGNGSKWLIGAAAAVALIGGGYLAWKNSGANEDRPQTAYNETYSANADRAGPLASDRGTLNESDTLAQSASDDSTPSQTRSAPVRRTTTRVAAAHEAVPEETFGITPISATTDADEIVVPGTRRPNWVRTPSARRLAALYPTRALQRGAEGEASLQCTVQVDGTLNCLRASETPGGFGPAALRVARTLRHAPQRADGSDATGTPVNLHVVFRMEDDSRRG